MRCPHCSLALTDADTAAGPRPHCSRCDHVYLPRGELDAILAETPRSYAPRDLETLAETCKERHQAALARPVVYCRCPECGEPMRRSNYGLVSFVLMHSCLDHGTWIARDDLGLLIEFVRGGGEVLELRAQKAQLEERLDRAQRDRPTTDTSDDTPLLFLG
ncbi:MAG: hypothetical protein AAGD14_03675 [Planctomycetota bacterium]